MNRQQRRAVEKQHRKGQRNVLDGLLKQAIQLHREGRFEEAEKVYRTVLKSIPDQPDACHFLGVLLHQCGKSEAGIAFIQRAVMAQPKYADAYNNLGNVYKEIGEFDKAVEAYHEVIELMPGHHAALNNLGVSLKEQGNFAEAIESLQKAIALAPYQADYYHNLGNAYREQGDLKKSVEACRQSIALRPYQADAYRSLWRSLYLAHDFEEAGKVLAQWLEFDPDNPIAQHTYAAHSGGDKVPQRASDGYVQQTFDNFAGSFDKVLERLEYRAPSLVADAVGRIYSEPHADKSMLDAGCGTGLCGPLLRPYASRLDGVDLSPKMLAKAVGRGVYDVLAEAELVSYLEGHPSSYDLIVSADTLVYFGELGNCFKAAKQALLPGGYLVFTLEREEETADFKLNIHGRYSHSQTYVEAALAEAGFKLCSIEHEQLRKEAGKPVEGLLVTALSQA